MRKVLIAAFCFVGGLSLSAQVTLSQAVSGFDTIVRQYNVVALGNMSLSGQDSEGGLAVRGNLTLNSAPVAARFGTGSDPTLFVSGSLTLNGDAHLDHGRASVSAASNPGLTYNSTDGRLTSNSGKLLLNADKSNPLTNAGPTDWNWATIESQVLSISETLKNAAQTGAAISVNTNSQTLVFSSNTTAAGVVVFTLDANNLGNGTYTLDGTTYNNVHNIAFNLAANQTAVVNVLNANGKSLFSGYNINNNADVASRLLWNLTGSGSVTMAGAGDGLYGSILAPQMTLTNSNTRVNGQVIAQNVNWSGAELHYAAFSPVGTNVLVPEPSTYALWGVGLCAAGWLLRRRLRAARR